MREAAEGEPGEGGRQGEEGWVWTLMVLRGFHWMNLMGWESMVETWGLVQVQAEDVEGEVEVQVQVQVHLARGSWGAAATAAANASSSEPGSPISGRPPMSTFTKCNV